MTFSIQRLGYLLKRDYFLRRRSVLMTSGIIFGAMFIIRLFRAWAGNSNPQDYNRLFTAVLVIWGAVSASYSFTEMHSRLGSQWWIMLPATALEKLLGRLIFVCIFLPVYVTLVTWLFSVITEGLMVILFQTGFMPFNPFALPDYGNIILSLWFGQSVFILGATWFRKTYLLKTLLTMFLISVFLGIYSMLLFRLSFGPGFRSISMSSGNSLNFFREDWSWDFIKYAGGILLTMFCWFTSWLRIKEAQNGI